MAEQDTPNLRAPLKIHLQGPAVRHHRIPLQDFVLFAKQVQTAVDRVARVLLGQGISTQPGRKPSEIIRSCSLDLVEVRDGSVAVICDLPIQSQAELFEDVAEDLGEEALTSFVEGIEGVGGQQLAMPRGYDQGVLLALFVRAESCSSMGLRRLPSTFARARDIGYPVTQERCIRAS